MRSALEVAQALAWLRERIFRAADRVHRDPAGVLLVGAAKGQSEEVIRAAVTAGLTDVGENYVQEAERMRSALGSSVRWHMIGHLQRNKAKRALPLFDVIQTVDSLALGQALARHAGEVGRCVPVLVEVNIGREAGKSGVLDEDVRPLVQALQAEKSLEVSGLMAVPPVGEAEEARPYFRRLRALRDELGLRELSMGMTDDFEVAIEEGATIVRIGRALFGERPPAGGGI